MIQMSGIYVDIVFSVMVTIIALLSPVNFITDVYDSILYFPVNVVV